MLPASKGLEGNNGLNFVTPNCLTYSRKDTIYNLINQPQIYTDIPLFLSIFSRLTQITQEVHNHHLPHA